MNNRPAYHPSRKNFLFQRLFHRPAHPARLLAALLLGGIGFCSNLFGQSAAWRYVVTLPGGVKIYLYDEGKTPPGGNPLVWGKAVEPDGSALVALSEWNCADKTYLTRQVTSYQPDQTAAVTQRKGFARTAIIPESAADFLYHRICQPGVPLIVRIIADRTALRALPDRTAALLRRTAQSGEQFQVVPETGRGGWLNVVDAATQQDYWLKTDEVEFVAEPKAVAQTKAATAKPSKQPSSKKRTGKKQRRHKPGG